MDRKLRILQVLSQRPEKTGSGLYVRSLLEYGLRSGHELYLLAAESRDSRVSDLPVSRSNSTLVEFRSDRLPFDIPGMSDVMPYSHVRFKDMTKQQIDLYMEEFSQALVSSVNRFKPDIIHCHHLWIVTSLTRRLFPSIPVVGTCHGTDLRQLGLLSSLRDYVLEGCRSLDMVMALTDAQREEICSSLSIDRRKVVVTGGGYREDLFRAGDKPEAPPVRIAYGGKISSAKGIPWLCRALSTVELPWELHVAGSGFGEDGAMCTAMLERLGKRVRLYGNLSQIEIADVMRKSHIFVLPSLHEGLPLVLLEALASGCRIVATGLPGIEEALMGVNKDWYSTFLPPLTENGERPLKSEEPSYIEGLAGSLSTQIKKAIDHGHVPTEHPSLANFRWSSVFGRVEKVYLRALSEI